MPDATRSNGTFISWVQHPSFLISLIFFAFIGMGLPDGMLGVAWPSIRLSFHLSLDALGSLLMATMVGYLLSSFASGGIVGRAGFGPLLMGGSLVAAVGLLGYALAPTWWVMILMGLVVGGGFGAQEAGLNSYAAVHHGPRLLNWLHASYGLGATLGPALMVLVLQAGQSWRIGYYWLCLGPGLAALLFWLTMAHWPTTVTTSAERPSDRESLLAPTVLAGITLFCLHSGIEMIIGQWAFSLLTEARGVPTAQAGIWLSVFWGVMTGGRVLFGWLVSRIRAIRLLRLSMLGVIAGVLVFWINLPAGAGLFGLALTGFSLSPIFPTLTAATYDRLGGRHAVNAIGYQVSAGRLGSVLMPALAGVLANRLGLEIIGPILAVLSLLMFLLHERMIAGKATWPGRGTAAGSGV